MCQDRGAYYDVLMELSGDEVDGGGFDEGGDGVAFLQGEFGAGGAGDQGEEGETGIEFDADQGAFGLQGHDADGQTVADTARGGGVALEGNFLTADADEDFRPGD